MKSLKFTIVIVIAAILGSCSTPQRLIEKAVKKDPKILNQYADTMFVYTDSIDTILQEVIRYVEKSPRIIDKIIDNRKEIKEKKIEARNERQETRQEGKTDRKEAVQDGRTDRKEAKQGGKTDRVSERQAGRFDRVEKRQDERTARSGGWWMFAVMVAFILGIITNRVIASRTNFRNKLN